MLLLMELPLSLLVSVSARVRTEENREFHIAKKTAENPTANDLHMAIEQFLATILMRGDRSPTEEVHYLRIASHRN